MSRALELLIRMHCEKTPTYTSGHQVLTGDVVIAILGKLQHDHRIGSDLIMAKWLEDENARSRVEGYALEWLSGRGTLRRPDLCRHIVKLALAVFYGKPTITQSRKLKSLWRIHSDQGRRSERLIRRWRVRIKLLQQDVFAEDSFQAEQTSKEIDRLESLIANERNRIHEYAIAQASKTCACPKCGGTGLFKVVNQCDACNGTGQLIPTAENIRQQLRHLGIARVTDKLWQSELKPVFEDALNWMHTEHGEAVKALDKQLVLERAA